jgi:hypothetical protein
MLNKHKLGGVNFLTLDVHLFTIMAVQRNWARLPADQKEILIR